LHSKLDPGSVDPKANVADVLDTVPDGPESINVSGGVVSLWIVQVRVAGVASVLPAASVARTA